MLRELALATRKRPISFCALREPSAMAVLAPQNMGLVPACDLEGCVQTWTDAAARREAVLD